LILDDIKQLEEIKKQINEGNSDKKILRKCKKLEKRYLYFPTQNCSVVKAYYGDRYGNKIAVLTNGEIIHFHKSSLSPNYLSFQFAFSLLVVLVIPTMFIVLFYFPNYSYIVDNYSIVLNALSVILLVTTFIRTWRATIKSIKLTILIGLGIAVNLTTLISNIYSMLQ
jgi:hypothetical protein